MSAGTIDKGLGITVDTAGVVLSDDTSVWAGLSIILRISCVAVKRSCFLIPPLLSHHVVASDQYLAPLDNYRYKYLHVPLTITLKDSSHTHSLLLS